MARRIGADPTERQTVSEQSDINRAFRIGDRAITTVAEYVIHAATRDGGVPPAWEDYPDIAQLDWLAVLQKVDRMTEAPNHDKYEAAYGFLALRASQDGPRPVRCQGCDDDHCTAKP